MNLNLILMNNNLKFSSNRMLHFSSSFLIVIIIFCNINSNAQCSVSVTSENAWCYGSCNGSAAITTTTGTAPYSYTWSSGGTNQMVNGLCIGKYSVSLTDKVGCTSTTSFSITFQDSLTVSAYSLKSSICYGTCDGTLIAIASKGVPPYTYVWTPGYVSGAIDSNLCAGSYTLNATDENGCISYTTSIINWLPQIQVTTSSTPAIGLGDNNGSVSATASGGTPAYTYVWSPGGITGQTVSNLACGAYSLMVTDSNGCTVAAEDTVNCLLGINEFGNNLSFNLFPNPTSTNVTIESSIANPVQITILNLLGQTVSCSTPPASSSYIIDVGDLPKAIYILQVQDLRSGTRGRQKVVVQ
jgi:hypothetical protein